jgi:hypothetical protein
MTRCGEGKQVNDISAEQNLFDDIPVTNKIITEPPIGKVEADWGDNFEQLVDLIGSEMAWKIAEVFAGSTIYIPKSIFTNKNYFDIRKKYKTGSTYRELSVEFGYTETHIRNIIHQKRRMYEQFG